MNRDELIEAMARAFDPTAFVAGSPFEDVDGAFEGAKSALSALEAAGFVERSRIAKEVRHHGHHSMFGFVYRKHFGYSDAGLLAMEPFVRDLVKMIASEIEFNRSAQTKKEGR